jgi:type IX secretion system substrate protein
MTPRYLKLISFIFFIVFIFFSNELMTRKGGTPTDDDGLGYTGGRRELGRTCATSDCHTGFSNAREGIITAPELIDGYKPGWKYTINVDIKEPGKVKFGFQASAQDSAGGFVGVFNPHDNTTQLNLIPGYITFTKNGTAAPDSFHWNFEWMAPSKGTAYIYVAANAANGNDSATGDVSYFDTLIIKKSLAAGIEEQTANEDIYSIYQNPVHDELQINLNHSLAHQITFEMFNISGELIQNQIVPAQSNRALFNVSGLSPGIYFLKASSADRLTIKRFVRL